MSGVFDRFGGGRGDELLNWLAAQRGGRIQPLGQAVTWFATSLADKRTVMSVNSWYRSMGELGYLELDWRSRSWWCPPPVACGLPESDGLIFITGGVSYKLLCALDDLGVDASPRTIRRPMQNSMSGQVQSLPEVPLPSAVFLECGESVTPSAIAHELRDFGACSSVAPAATISRRLPQISAELPPAAPPPMSAETQRFDQTVVGDPDTWINYWLPPQRLGLDPHPGLFKWETADRGLVHRVYDGDRWLEVDLFQGVYWVLHAMGEDSPIGFTPVGSRGTGTLKVRRGARLPHLQARCAVLCSGLVPQLGGTVHKYPNVPRDIALRIASSLGQELVDI